MNRIYAIFDQNGELVMTNERYKTYFYRTLGEAKDSTRKHIRLKNEKLIKPDRSHFDDYTVVEYELVEKERHKI